MPTHPSTADQQLAALLAERGCEVPAHRVAQWREHDLLPRLQRRSRGPGGGRGTTTHDTLDVVDRALLVYDCLEQHHLPFWQVRLVLFDQHYPVPADRIKADFTRALAEYNLRVVDDQKGEELLDQMAAIAARPVRRRPARREVKERLQAAGDPTSIADYCYIMLQGMYAPSDLPHESASLRALATGLGLEAEEAELVELPRHLEQLSFSTLNARLANLSVADLEQGRDLHAMFSAASMQPRYAAAGFTDPSQVTAGLNQFDPVTRAVQTVLLATVCRNNA